MFRKRVQPGGGEPWALEDAAIDPASQWQARPVLAFLLRAFAFLLPIAASLGTSVLLTRLLPFPSSTTHLVLWYVAILAATSLVLVVVERLAKKALPLAVLLRVTTMFPDHAPSRVRTALRSADSVKDVDTMLQEALRLGHGDRARAAQVILQLATSLSYHDRQTRGHAERVRTYTDLLAQEMKLGGTARAKLGWAALLHDIGKLRVPKEVLGKAGKLDAAEWEQMCRHPRLGLELAAPLVPWLGEWAGGIADHHENFDGSGYPEGKAGGRIALAGRMIRVADTFDVMTSVRSYKKPVSPEAARRELVDGSGRFFDSDVVRSFLRIGLGRLRWTAGPLSWLAQTPILRALEVARELGTAAAAAGAATVGAAALGVNLMLPAGADAAVPPVPPVSDHVIVVEAGSTHTEAVIDAALSAAGFAVVVVEPPGHGTAEAGAGGISYTPEPGYTGPDTVGFQVVGAGGSAVGAASLLISVVPGEAVPGPADDPAATSEDQAVVVAVLANDPVGSTVQSVTAPGHGTATLQGDGRIRYEPAADFAGTDSFRYEAAAGGRSLGTALVTVEVSPVADPPLARPDTVVADAGRAVVVRVLENDDDPDGDLDPSTLRLVEGPARGEARVAGAGIWYRPEEGTGGRDRLVYEICDRGGLCATAEVACTVAAVNRPPAAADDSAATSRGTAVSIDVLANDTDPDGDRLTVAAVGRGSLGGTATCPASGPCRYVPPVFPAGSHGSAEDTFTYTVADPAGAESRATVTVTIDLGDPPAAAANRPPTARPDEVVLLEDSPGVSFAPADGDTDPDGDRVTVMSVSSPSSGAVTSLGGGSYRFVPAADFSGTVTVQYTVTDGHGGYGASTVTFTVRPVNDAPSFVAGGEVTVVEDSGAAVVPGWASGMVAGPADEAGQGLRFEVVSNDNPGLFAGVVVVDALSGDVGFTPGPDAVGSARVGVVLVDDGGRADGGVDASPAATLRITVSPVNDPPSFTAGDRVSVAEDSGAYQAVWATGIEPGGAGEGGQALAFSIVSNSNPGLFAAAPALDAGTGVLSFTPAPDARGSATLRVVLRDDGGTAGGGAGTSPPATLRITVRPVNDAPSFVAGGEVTVVEDSGAAVVPGWASGMAAGPADEAGQGLRFEVVSNDNPGLFAGVVVVDALSGDVGFTPGPDAVGSARVGVVLVDDGGRADGGVDASPAAMLRITVSPVNDPPSFTAGPDVAGVEDSGPVAVGGWAGVSVGPADEAGQAALSSIVSNSNPGLFSAGPAIAADGTLSYTPAPDANGAALLVAVLRDDGGTAGGGEDTSPPAIFAVTLAAVNDAPSFVAGGDVGVGADSGMYSAGWASGMVAGPADEAGQVLRFEVVSNDDPGLFAAAPSVSPVGVLSFMPAPARVGSALVGVRLVDDGGTERGGVDVSPVVTFRISVANGAPVAGDDGPLVVDEDQPLLVAGSLLLANDMDPDGQPLVVVSAEAASHAGGTLVGGAGSFTYLPPADWYGTDWFDYTVGDGTGTDVGTVIITVRPVNDAPSFVAGGDVGVGADSGMFSASWASGMVAGPADEAGQVLRFEVVSNDDPGLFAAAPSVSPVGVLSFMPAPARVGSALVGVRLVDDGGTERGGVDVSPVVTFRISVADLTITKVSDAGGQVVAGQRITYTITVANPGPGAHSGVVVVDPLPAGTSWVSTQVTRFVDGPSQTVGDNFDSETYAANSGTINWAGPWVETNDDGTPDGGGVVIRRHDGRTTLELQRSDRRITRAADLSAYDRAVLSYDWKRRDLRAGEWVAIEVSDDAGASWTEVARHAGPGNDAGFFAKTGIDLSAFTSAGFQIRLRTAPGQGDNHELRVDDLFVEVSTRVPSTGPGGAPATLNPPATLPAGESMTITLVVEVDDPLALGIGEIVNVAAVTSDQQATAHSAAAHDVVTAANRAPVAGDDGPLLTDEDQPLLVAGSLLLANDSDPDGQPLVVVSADAASHAGGTVAGGAGSFTYLPPADWHGMDWFDYTVSDGIATDVGTVIITVRPVNDAPVAGDDPDADDDPAAFEVITGGALDLPAALLLDDDLDVDGDPLALSPSGPSATARGSVECDGTGCTYTSDGSGTGIDTFTYTVTDGAATDTATVTVTVSDYVASPVVLVVNEVYFQERFAGEEAVEFYNPTPLPVDLTGLRLTDGNVLIGDIDVAGPGWGPLDFTFPATDAFGAPSVLPAGGYAVIWMGPCGGESVAPGAALQYSAGMAGLYVLDDPGDDVWLLDADSRLIDYVAWSQGAGHEMNTPPPVSFWDPAYLRDLVAPDRYSIALVPSGIDGNTSACWETSTSGEAGARPECAGAPATVDSDPVADRFTSLGESNTVSSNRPPVAVDDGPFALSEDGSRVFAAAEWLGNDSDPDGDPLTSASAGPLSVAGGTIAGNGDGTFTYRPPADFNGADSFSYTVSDGKGGFDTATVRVAVAPVNDPPSFAPGPNVTVDEDSGPYSAPWATAVIPGPANEAGQAVTFEVLANSAPSLFSSLPSLNSSGVLTFTPAPGAHGTALIEVRLVDDGGTAGGGDDTGDPIGFVITIASTPGIDLAIDAAAPGSVDVGVDFTLTWRVHNYGGTPSGGGAEVTLTLPAGVAFRSGSAVNGPACSYAWPLVTCVITPAVPSGAVESGSIVLRASAAGPLVVGLGVTPLDGLFMNNMTAVFFTAV